MATFTIDLLSGDVYLFNKTFSSSGGTPTSGATYPQVPVYSLLPSAAANNGKIYVVLTATGSYVLNRHDAGLYYSNGIIWSPLPNIPAYFASNNFQVYDSSITTKGLSFVTSGITSGVFRKLKIQDADGTIAYLTDLNSKLDVSVFDTYTGNTLILINTKANQSSLVTYTGTTAPATYVTKSTFNAYTGATVILLNAKLNKSDFVTFTGTTLPATYYNKTQINAYTGATQILINGKQNTLTAGTGISIVGNTISVTGGSSNLTLQLKDISGETNINTIAETAIVWTTQEYAGTSLTFTGGSKIKVNTSGDYKVSYTINAVNQTDTTVNIGSLVRKNGDTDITPSTSSSFGFNTNNDGANVLPDYNVALLSNDYLELVTFRIGNSGNVLTKPNGSWIRIEKTS